MKTLVDCGCDVRVHADGSGAEIDYCPLHAAAEEMLKALRAAQHALRVISKTVRDNDPELKLISTAIARAPRRSTETIFRLAAQDGEDA